ncbi:type II toxin-antitoxin system RelE/ParE family toxin [Alteromonas sp. IB21]|uniref:type II toxin-antitoxin system RelE/ParE family toxin n=1 Tax=Alteromonas sp. IB21 TaxID=2779369 RepID=UPI001E462ECB|nr:type II toxin-antitoxin system RelE/ParE family toxin [Alteromonas sp. IB21]
MASYKLSELAEDDLRLIAIKTIEKWGQDQAEAYILLLHEALIKIANEPNIGRKRPELFDNARSFPVQKTYGLLLVLSTRN